MKFFASSDMFFFFFSTEKSPVTKASAKMKPIEEGMEDDVFENFSSSKPWSNAEQFHRGSDLQEQDTQVKTHNSLYRNHTNIRVVTWPMSLYNCTEKEIPYTLWAIVYCTVLVCGLYTVWMYMWLLKCWMVTSFSHKKSHSWAGFSITM